MLFRNNSEEWHLPTDPARRIRQSKDAFSTRLFRSNNPDDNGKFLLLLTDPRVHYQDRFKNLLNDALGLFSLSDLVLFYNRDRVYYNHVLMYLHETQGFLPPHILGLLTYQPELANKLSTTLADGANMLGGLSKLLLILSIVGIPFITGLNYKDNPTETLMIWTALLVASYIIFPTVKSALFTPTDEDSAPGDLPVRLARIFEDRPIRNAVRTRWQQRSQPGIITVVLPTHHTAAGIQERVIADLDLEEMELSNL